MRMMNLMSTASATALCLLSSPALAQDAPALAAGQELAAMRAELARLASRVDELEQDLAEAKAAPPVTAAAPEPAKKDTKLSWKGAPEIEGEGGWSFKPFGRLQFDAGFTSVPDATGLADGFGNELRRARIGVEGSMPGGFGYKFETEFANGNAEITDAIITYKDGPLTYTLGQHNNFQSLEELNSSRFTTMIERAAFTDAFNFQRKVGASVQYNAKDVLLQGGVFTDNIDALSNKNWSMDARAVYMPKLGDAQLHFGGSVHYASLNNAGNTVRYRQRPLVHFTGTRFVDTRSIAADSELGIGIEAAGIKGPFHAVAEGYWQKPGATALPSDPTFFGGYGEVGFFLTGNDKRGYKGGKFDRVKPAKPVGKGGFGALEVNLRYDYLDLNSGPIIGGKQNAYEISLVWTPTDYVRFLMNYGRLNYDDAVYAAASGNRSYGVDAFGIRAQVDF